MKIEEKTCKSIMSDSGLYGVDYSINPYTGCEHGCKYCYATFMKQYTNHSEEWGNFVEVKVNAKNALEKDLMRKSKGSILISSVTDPYQPVEERYEITRKILERLADTKFPVTILTKSDLVLRDLDVLNKFKHNRISVGLTINYAEDKDREIWEPNSPGISRRIKALKKISKENIDCYVHLGPYFEGITKLEKIMDNVEPYIEELQVEDMNFEGNERRIMQTIRENYPSLVNHYQRKRENSWPFKIKLKEKIEKLRKTTTLRIRLFLD